MVQAREHLLLVSESHANQEKGGEKKKKKAKKKKKDFFEEMLKCVAQVSMC